VPWRLGFALAFLLAGLAIRAVAIVTLGRFFTARVSIQEDHRLVRRGLFRHVRHPSYSGLLLAFAGLGLTLGNWLSLAAILVPITASVLYRIRVEESFLEEKFGREYAEYRRSTRCLVPGLY
jgi:protein-S-isoprenylcysteine O-methyltransferase Ste14